MGVLHAQRRVVLSNADEMIRGNQNDDFGRGSSAVGPGNDLMDCGG
jgi:hypothetical protein